MNLTMQMEPVATYELFRDLGLTTDQYDFSRRWLGQADSYFSVLKARRRPFPPTALMRLKFRLDPLVATYRSLLNDGPVPQLLEDRRTILLRLSADVERELDRISAA